MYNGVAGGLIDDLGPGTLRGIDLRYFRGVPPSTFVRVNQSLFGEVGPLTFRMLAIGRTEGIALFAFASLAITRTRRLNPRFATPPSLSSLDSIRRRRFQGLTLGRPYVKMESVGGLSDESSGIVGTLRRHYGLM